jgi:hypothetical protein
MSPRLVLACWFVLASFAAGVGAQTGAPAAMPPAGLRQAALNGATSAHADVEVRSTEHMVTVIVTGSTLAAHDTQAWDAEAAAIADAIARAMAGASEYTGVMSIHVDYLDAAAGRSTPARTFVFNRTPAGSFARPSR